ncbi:MAG: GNAT family N-acetyltransferase [Burkholderiales bacterium]|nr:GNAT family N-acetyltransferase [Burkholderiales bacterium]
MLRYKAGASTERDIREHLGACDGHFVPPLRARVNIDEYARKLAERSLTIEAWHDEVLVGLVAAYVSATGDSCFVSNVSVLPEFKGRGIASTLLANLDRHPACANVRSIQLEVSKGSVDGIRLYERFGFQVTGERGDQIVMQYTRNNDGARVPKGPEA